MPARLEQQVGHRLAPPPFLLRLPPHRGEKPGANPPVLAPHRTALLGFRAIAANISTKDDLKHLVEETNRVFGRIDTLVCNAASNPYFGPMAGIEDGQFRKVLENNVLAKHWLIGFVAPQMLERKDGSIIIVSSIGGLRGSPVLGAYCISKAADLQMAEILIREGMVRLPWLAAGGTGTALR